LTTGYSTTGTDSVGLISQNYPVPIEAWLLMSRKSDFTSGSFSTSTLYFSYPDPSTFCYFCSLVYNFIASDLLAKLTTTGFFFKAKALEDPRSNGFLMEC
jgi:hypothetical protein